MGVWAGGVCNGHFPESEKYASDAEICRKTLKLRTKDGFFCQFQAPNFEISERKKMKFHSPSPSLPPLDYLLSIGRYFVT